MKRVAIIGTSGRNPFDKKNLTKRHLDYMAFKVGIYIKNVLNLKNNQIILVSGGSAWADHTAIQLFLTGEFAGLELYLPTHFDTNTGKYIDTYQGNLLNTLHMECHKKTGVNVLQEIAQIMTKENVKVSVINGFKARNTFIAENCDYLIAFTFEKMESTLKGGTFDTWCKTNVPKIHVRLE